jgi:hypothetical protein
MREGKCHCGAIRYKAAGEPVHHALCHCTDCRRSAGAPMVGWAMFKTDEVEIDGEPQVYSSSENGRRHFCGACGTGLFYTNDAMLPGMTDIQSATLDDPGALPATAQIQIADRISWMEHADALPKFERFPSQG